MEKIHVLGTGNAMVTQCYNTCYVLEADGQYLLVDCGGGNGILRQLAAAYPGHVAEDTGRVPAQETETHGSAAAGRCPGAVPGSGQQRKKET